MRRPRSAPGSARNAAGRQPAPAALLLALGLVTANCSAPVDPMPTELSSERLEAALRLNEMRDARAAFGARLCREAADVEPGCRALRGPPVAPATAPRPPETAPRARLVFVAGLFAECLAHWARPFEDILPPLAARGHVVSEIPVAGRGTAAENGARIARALAALPRDDLPVVVIAHSKGVVDVLEALVRHPEIRNVPSAMIAIAGAHNGSHLAEQRGDVYEAIVASLPMRNCAPGSGEEVRELRRDRRRAWWQVHAATIRLPIFALVGLPRPGSVAPFLSAGRAAVARFDPLNDGNIAWDDALVPNGSLLGFVDADHWSIAIPIERVLQPAAPGTAAIVPRARLLEAALDVVMGSPDVRRAKETAPK